jgi:hypothetical protein
MSAESRLGVGILAAALALGIAADALLRATPYGLNLLLWALAFLAALFALARWGRPLLIGTRRLLLVPLVVSAALFCWRDSSWLAALNAAALLGSAGLCALSVPGFRLHLAGLGDVLLGCGRTLASALIGVVDVVFRDVSWPDVGRRVRSPLLLASLRGLAVALPLLVVFGGLFAAADAVFSKLLATTIPEIDEPLTHALVVVGWGWLSGGLLRAMLAERPDGFVPGQARMRLGATEAVVALGLLDALFLAFVAVQVRYFFGGRAHVEHTVGLTYAEYARQGFFELVAVAALVLPLLLVGDWLLRREPRRGRTAFRLLALVLVGLLFVVMASALQRMRLYGDQFGLTELRFYTTAFMLLLAVVFVWFAATVLRGRREIFAIGALTAGFAAVVVLNAVNPDATIARINVERAAHGKPVDVAYLGRLSDDAVPFLVRELPRIARSQPESSLQAALLADGLLARLEREHDWRTWNWSRERARSQVREHRAELERLAELP